MKFFPAITILADCVFRCGFRDKCGQNGHCVDRIYRQYTLGLERIHQVTNTIRIAIQGGEYDTYREYTFSQRLN